MAFWWLVLGLAQAQAESYLSNLDGPTLGSESVASESWLAVEFRAGPNPQGYALDSVSLRMATPTGSPSGFQVMLYSHSGVRFHPGSVLGAMDGQHPSTEGVFSYTASDLWLSASTPYFVVITAASPTSMGSYAWATTGFAYDAQDTWNIVPGYSSSPDGVDWGFVRAGVPQFAVYATAVPEPSSLVFLALGLGGFVMPGWIWSTRDRQAVERERKRDHPAGAETI